MVNCYKIAFEHKHEAVEYISNMRKRGKLKGKPLHPYVCPHCNKIHLTSQEDDPKRVEVVRKFYERLGK